MKEHIHKYKQKLEKELMEYMDSSVGERSAKAICCMIDCWNDLDKMEKKMSYSHDFTHKDAEKWNADMVNEDGSYGGHWTVAQTTSVANSMGIMFDHITAEEFNVAMNAMYSDYYKIGEKYGVNRAEFYADLAKAFLFDKDAKSPKEKLSAYYNCIVKKD